VCGCEGSGLESPDAAERTTTPCAACEGSRLSPLPRAQRLAGERYHEVTRDERQRGVPWLKALRFEGARALIADAPHKELVRRLSFVDEVGLDYLSLDRLAATLSGGEMQRLRLAAQLGSGLTGALYVLDEPTIGLHPRDTRRLLANLRKLVDMGSDRARGRARRGDDPRGRLRWSISAPRAAEAAGASSPRARPAEVLVTAASPTAARSPRSTPSRRAPALGGSTDVAPSCSKGARAHNLDGRRATSPSGGGPSSQA
jgi:excinuclease ABC subunit A